ncbi:putative junctional adhesion molecule-like [Triplophysa rosa]|uniref:Junctional adhesion molecule-like n=1 Tax=Triplophysa rosa TaxID=992332 RepID=A0A9W7TUV6_TRIRA|nr:putative junctional adhesion molecule-like [Triplophysa rosa]
MFNFNVCHVIVFKMLLMGGLLSCASRFTVKGPSGPLVVPLGGSVLLPCSVDSLSSLEDLEVEWKRSDSQTLIHLYQDGDIRPDSQHEDYHDRAHFFTENIKQGNFSLLMKNVRQEDEGQYTCTVHSGQESGETVVEIKDVERLIVSGSDQSLSVYVGEDVTLNCSVDSHIPPEHIEEVSWKKRVKDEHITLYRDRVEFFSDEIHRGNFSLRLKRVRTEDKGLYMCHVFAGRFSDNTTIVLQQLDATDSLLLFCFCLSYSVHHLRMSLVFCPNLIMCFAFVFWGVSEGSVSETVCCCALYILRPLLLLWTAPYINDFKGLINLKRHFNII